MNWYLSDGTNILNLGSNCTELTLGSSKRAYSIVDNAGSNGGQIKGWGNYSPKTFQVKFQLRATTGQLTYHNAARTVINQWFSRMKNEVIWLYIVSGDVSPITKRTRVYCTNLGNEKINYQRGLIEKSYEMVSPSGYFENTAITDYDISITDSTVYELSVVNAGDIEVPVMVSFTPASNETLFQCELYDGFGFQISATYFNSSEEIIYNTANNNLIISGQSVNATNYLTGGSVFNLPVGTQTLYIKTSGLGTTAVNVSYYERYI